jgi:hypothetical protein
MPATTRTKITYIKRSVLRYPTVGPSQAKWAGVPPGVGKGADRRRRQDSEGKDREENLADSSTSYLLAQPGQQVSAGNDVEYRQRQLGRCRWVVPPMVQKRRDTCSLETLSLIRKENPDPLNSADPRLVWPRGYPMAFLMRPNRLHRPRLGELAE